MATYKSKEQKALESELRNLALTLNRRLERVESAGLQDTLVGYKHIVGLFEKMPETKSVKPRNPNIQHVENRFRTSWGSLNVDTLLDAKYYLENLIGATNVSLGSEEVLKESIEVKKIFKKSLKLEMPLPENATEAEIRKRNRQINRMTNDFLESKRVIPEEVMNSEQRVKAIKEMALQGITKSLEEVFNEYISEHKGEEFMFDGFLYFIRHYMDENRLFGTTIQDGNWINPTPRDATSIDYVPYVEYEDDDYDDEQFRF